MKTLKSIYWLALTAALALAACSKEDPAPTPEPNPEPEPEQTEIVIEQTEYTLDADEERTATVAFTATADWTLSVAYDDAESSADWLTVTPTSGTAGEQTVELSAARNFRASARTAYADIACGKQSVRLTVTQAAASDATDFTAQFDPDFAKELQKQGIIADAEHITPEDMEKIAAITSLDVSGTEDAPGALTSLQGIEYFESLTFLKCDSNQLTSLDVSANTALTFLMCNSNQLTSLDVSANTALTYLYCHSNQLTKLDVSANTALTYLSCSSNSLTSLDVSRNTALMNLSCYSNSLTSLDVSRNTALTDLWCESNQLTELNVSANTALTQLVCNANQLTELDVRQNTALTGLWCYDNQLTKLDVSANTALTWLSCENNPGDGVSTFPVTAWFDNETVPAGLNVHSSSWRYDGKTITIDFRKAE